MKIELRTLVMALDVLRTVHKTDGKPLDGETYTRMISAIALLEHAVERRDVEVEVTA